MECNYQYACSVYWIYSLQTMAICAIGLQEKVEVKHSEPLSSLPEVAVIFYLTHILTAIIAFLWDALMRPFWPDPISIFFIRRAGYETSLVLFKFTNTAYRQCGNPCLELLTELWLAIFSVDWIMHSQRKYTVLNNHAHFSVFTHVTSVLPKAWRVY